MQIVEEKQVRERMQAGACVQLMRDALRDLESGKCVMPQRLLCRMPNTAVMGFMPAYLGRAFGAKVLTAYGPNAGSGYPTHIGYVMMFESEHCTVSGLVDATAVTEIRTGAVSAVATDLLARRDAHCLAVIGAGAQARSHLAAIREVRDITQVQIYDLNMDTAGKFAEEAESCAVLCIQQCPGCSPGRGHHLYTDTVQRAFPDPGYGCTGNTHQCGRYVYSYHTGSRI